MFIYRFCGFFRTQISSQESCFVLVSVWWNIVIYLELLSFIQHQARPPLQMHFAPWLSTTAMCREVKSPKAVCLGNFRLQVGESPILACTKCEFLRFQGFGQQNFFFNLGCKMKKVWSSSGWADPTTCAASLWPHQMEKRNGHLHGLFSEG